METNKRTIKVVPYDPIWAVEFEKAKTFYEALLEALPVVVEHVGSTSVKGLYAKPVLDIDIIVSGAAVSQEVIKALESVGYVHIGDLGIVGREAFRYDPKNPNITWMRHHLYVCLEGAESVTNHLMLRRHLRNNPQAVEAYSQLKLALAKAHPHDIDAYVEGKSKLIGSFLAEEGMHQDVLTRIERANKKDAK